MITRFIGLAFVLVSLLVTSCGEKQEAASDKPQAAKSVQIDKVALAQLDDYYEAVGTVRSKTSSVLASKIMGSIVALHVREGDRVKAGQLLIEIDNRDAAAQLQKAQAGLREANEALEEIERTIRAAQSAKASTEANQALASATFNRYKALLEREAVSKQEFDEVQAKHRVAEAELDRADRTLHSLAAKRSQVLARIDQAKADVANVEVYVGYGRITAPFAGIVSGRHTDVGQTATPGAPLLTIEDDARYRLEASVEESQIGLVRIGTEVAVLVDALGSEPFDGRVAEIVPASDPASRSFTVKIDLKADSGRPGLRSGLFGKGRFATGRKQAIAVPLRAVVRQGQLVGVYIVDQSGVARLRLIKTGKTYGEQIEVLTGLDEGERIVVSDITAVKDGDLVQGA
jgi:multidrug efflux pump subunit AcrA (membrane-fusion protein)